jgi:hypothetical protein
MTDHGASVSRMTAWPGHKERVICGHQYSVFLAQTVPVGLVTGEVDASQVDEDGFIIVDQPSPSQTRRGNDSFYSSDSDEDEGVLNRKLYVGGPSNK